MASVEKFIQQAGKFIQMGKLAHALEQYLKAHKTNPEDTTIVNTIGDVYAGWARKLKLFSGIRG